MTTQTINNIIQGGFDFAVLLVLIFAAVDDIKTRMVRPRFQIALLVVSLLHIAYWFIAYPDALWGYALNGIIAGVGMLLIHLVLVLIFKTGIGGADTKVTSIMALYLGIWPSVLLVLLHSIGGFIYVKYQKIVNKRHLSSLPLMVPILFGYIGVLVGEWGFRLFA